MIKLGLKKDLRSKPCPDHEYLGLAKEAQDKKHPKKLIL
jgi:hypothetical protein